MKTDYCAYPPEIAADLEITEHRDGARTVYIVGSAFVGRYLLLRATEYQVVGLIDGAARRGAFAPSLGARRALTSPLTNPAPALSN